MATTPASQSDVIDASHVAENVRLIKDFAVYMVDAAKPPEGFTYPTSASWTPGDTVKPVGWATDKGLTLKFGAGSSTDIKGHDQSVVKSVVAKGNFELTIPAMECRKTVAEAFFGVSADTDGSIKSNAEPGKTWNVIILGIDTDGRPVVLVLHNATVTDRGDISLAGGSAIELSITLTTHPSGSVKQLEAYGLTVDA